jgi:hypothetical protein
LTSCATIGLPRAPVAPATKIFMTAPFSFIHPLDETPTPTVTAFFANPAG